MLARTWFLSKFTIAAGAVLDIYSSLLYGMHSTGILHFSGNLCFAKMPVGSDNCTVYLPNHVSELAQSLQCTICCTIITFFDKYPFYIHV